MLKEPDISTFRLEILRKDRLQELYKIFPEADAFQRMYLMLQYIGTGGHVKTKNESNPTWMNSIKPFPSTPTYGKW